VVVAICDSVHHRSGTFGAAVLFFCQPMKEDTMGRGILLWLIGVPIPIIILLALFWR
jgi:hypothetical protein